MSVYEIITDRIVKSLEEGTVPWQKPWTTKMPINFVSRKPYRGINPFLLSLQNRKSPYWLSYKQMVDLGGNLKMDDKKASMVIFWKWLDANKDVKDADKKDLIPMLRYYNVFNLDQIEGIEVPAENKLEFTPVESAEKVVAGYPNPPKFREGGDRACYSPSNDEITMPVKESFTDIEGYYSTLFHEMTHSTGHTSRLARTEVVDIKHFGSESYSQEELVAELGASFLQAETGIASKSVQQNSEAYIKSWIGVLKDDKKFIVHASAKAQKAVDWIMNRKFEEGGNNV
jgi:antirestriction protein ArdC